jgi:hypothetical protein
LRVERRAYFFNQSLAAAHACCLRDPFEKGAITLGAL